MAGWVSLHRSITKHWLWECEEFSKSQAWIDLILHACHKPNSLMIKGKLYKLERGQQSRSMLTLSKQWKWSRGKVKRFLDALATDSMIEQQTDINTTIITICNYNSFQDGDTTNGTADDTTNGHQTIQRTDNERDTNNKDNKVNNGNKWNYEKCMDIWNEVKDLGICEAKGCRIVPKEIKSSLSKVHKEYQKYCKRTEKCELERHEWFRAYATGHLKRCSRFVGTQGFESYRPQMKDLARIENFEKLINE